MAKEIALTGQFNVRRKNAAELLKIRRGEVFLQELLDRTDKLVEEIDVLFKESSLPDKIDKDLVNNILKEMRKESLTIFYE
jgi:hypothetical protein